MSRSFKGKRSPIVKGWLERQRLRRARKLAKSDASVINSDIIDMVIDEMTDRSAVLLPDVAALHVEAENIQQALELGVIVSS